MGENGRLKGGAMLENRRDEAATKAAGFHSKKSFISFAGHQYLYGLEDHTMRRVQIFTRAGAICEGCKIPHYVNWDIGEWHHTQKTKGGRRCDGMCCGIWVCKDWHEKHHGRRTRFGEGRGVKVSESS